MFLFSVCNLTKLTILSLCELITLDIPDESVESLNALANFNNSLTNGSSWFKLLLVIKSLKSESIARIASVIVDESPHKYT